MGLISRVSSRTYRLFHKMASLINDLLKSQRDQDSIYENFRDPHEDTKHWYCRKEFIRENYANFFDGARKNDDSKLTEQDIFDRLDCLSRCWVNMEFYKTGYSQSLMDEINSMADGLPPLVRLLADGEHM